MAKKSKSEIKLGATVRLRAQSGEIVEGRVVHLWEEKSVPMVRVSSGDLVYAYAGRCSEIEMTFEIVQSNAKQKS